MGTEKEGEWVKYGMTKEKWDHVHDEASRASYRASRLIDNLPENHDEYMAELTEPWPEAEKPKKRKISKKHE